MRIKGDPRGVTGDIVELPELSVAPITVVRGDVLNLLRSTLYRAKFNINAGRAA